MGQKVLTVVPTQCPSNHLALVHRETEAQSRTEDFAYAQVLLFIEIGQIWTVQPASLYPLPSWSPGSAGIHEGP